MDGGIDAHQYFTRHSRGDHDRLTPAPEPLHRDLPPDDPAPLRLGLALRGIAAAAGRMPHGPRQRELDRDARAALEALFAREGLV